MPLLRYRAGLVRAPAGAHARFFARGVAPAIPPIPQAFGEDLFPTGWGMLGNDAIGDCTIAGAMHAVMAWEKLAGRSVRFTALDAEDDYRAVSGYVPSRPDTDVGADMVTVAQYWHMTGVRDCADRRYGIAAYASIEGSDAGKPDLDHVCACAWLFGAAGLGIMVSAANEDQFDRGIPWTPDSDADEYHFVPVIGRGSQGLWIVTWGKACWMTTAFFAANCKEALAYLPTAADPHASLFAAAA